MKIDHFAVSGMKLEEATEYVESTLGYKMEKGGKHKLFGWNKGWFFSFLDQDYLGQTLSLIHI